MSAGLRLLAVLPHPDDESLGLGSTLARYANEGVETYLLCATRGEQGWTGPEEDNPGPDALGRIRESELRCAAACLGLKEVHFLDYCDGEVDRANPVEAAGRIAEYIRRIRPQVVVTFGPDGIYGHPDHIAVAQFTLAAVLEAASGGNGLAAHCVSKLYYLVETGDSLAMFQRRFGAIEMEIDGVVRSQMAWPDWAFSAVLDNRDYVPAVLRAIQCHLSQVQELGDLDALPDDDKLLLAGQNSFLRAFSLVNGGRRVETDLFEGLR